MKHYLKKASVLILSVFCLSLMLAATTLAASNKGVRVKAVYPAAGDDNWDSLNVMFGATQKKTCKATTSMKISAKLYIPVAALSKDSFFIIDPMAGLQKGKKYYGTVQGKWCVQINYDNGKPVVYKQMDGKVAGKLSSKYCTVKKKKGFYVVTLKKLPLCSHAFDMTPEKKLKINTSKKLSIDTFLRVNRVSPKAWTGYIYADDLILHVKKSMKMTFDKKDYYGVFAYRFDQKKVTASVKKIK